MITLKTVTGELVELDVDRLQGVDLSSMGLHRLILRGQNLASSCFKNADLRNAILDFCIFSSSDFCGAGLYNLVARGSDFSECGFQGARFSGAELQWSSFNKAVFGDADLGGATLAHTDLRGANLSTTTRLMEADIEGAIFDEETKWPDAFDPLERGAELLKDLDGVPWGKGTAK